jgi:hypothetical protein
MRSTLFDTELTSILRRDPGPNLPGTYMGVSVVCELEVSSRIISWPDEVSNSG